MTPSICTITLNPAVDLEYTVPELIKNAVLRAPVARRDFGGKGFNVSRMLQVLGAESTALGFVGGHNGKVLEEGLNSLGIATDFVWTAEETRINTSIVGQQTNEYLKVNEPGPTISAREAEALLQKVAGLARPGGWWVLAGSLPPGAQKSIYADLARAIKAAGARVVLDTSGAALAASLAGAPYLVKPNALEAGELTGLPVDSLPAVARAARAILPRGVETVVVSLGKDGAMLASPDSLLLGHPPQIKEQNPIGAGDAMVAGLVYCLSAELPLETALRWGLACGAAAASQPGTDMGSRELIESLVSQTDVEELEYAS